MALLVHLCVLWQYLLLDVGFKIGFHFIIEDIFGDLDSVIIRRGASTAGTRTGSSH